MLRAAALTGVFAWSPAVAQTGGIQVIVFDPGGQKPVPGVEITLASADRQIAETKAATNAQGVAYFPVLRVGSRYVVTVVHPGFARQEITGIRVRVGDVTRLPIRLASSFSEKVVLSGRREAVDLERSETSSRFGAEFIDDLPVMNRFYQDVLKLAAGVQDADGDGNPNVHGARAADFRAEVGGISNQDPLTGEWMSFVNPDSIEELEVLTAGAGVEFSRAQGGFANIIQKQGSNDFEGRAGFLWRSSRIDTESATEVAGVPSQEYRWWQPSFHLSGPIVKDRLWYRLSHEWIRNEVPIVTSGTTATQTRDQSIVSDQITWQVSPRNKLSFGFSYDPMVLGNLGVGALTPASASVRKESGGPTYTLNWTAPVSASILVDSLVSWQEGHQRILPAQDAVPNDCSVGMIDFATGDYLYSSIAYGQCVNLKTGRTSGSYPIRQEDDRQRLTVKSQATLFTNRFLGSSHQFRFGLVVENERYFREIERLPESQFSSVKLPVSSSDGQSSRVVEFGRWDSTFAIPGSTRAKVLGANIGLYAEDMWKPASNLTFTLGVRLDREEIHTSGFEPFDPAAESAEFERVLPEDTGPARLLAAGEVFTAYEGIYDFARVLAAALGVRTLDVLSLLSPVSVSSDDWDHKRRRADVDLTNTNVAPRLAVAWDPGRDGKSKLSATFGRYYGTVFLGVPAVELGPATTTVTLEASRPAGNSFWSDAKFAAGLNPAASVQMVDRDLRTPHQDEVTLSFEREVLPETALRLTWVRRRFQDQIQTIDINHYSYDHGTCLVAKYPGDPWIDFSTPDGKIDDCDGIRLETEVAGTQFATILEHTPDGYADSYTYNPGWGSVFLVGNFNSATYDGLVLELIRRQHRGWQMQASYTYSKAVGDAEEWSSPLGDDRSILDAERGYLSYDQRHVLKASATTITPWGFRFGASGSWASGLPYSILTIETAYDTLSPQFPVLVGVQQRQRMRYPTGRRNDRRNRPMLQLNVKVDREWEIPGGRLLQTSIEMFNLLNDRYYQIYNRDLDLGRQLNGRNEAYRVNGRQYQIGMKLSF